MKRVKHLLCGLLLLTLMGCGGDEMIVIEPTPTPTTPPPPTAMVTAATDLTEVAIERICLVRDTDGVADNSFWRNIQQGLDTVVSDYDVEKIVVDVASQNTAGLDECVARMAEVIITVDASWYEFTRNAALANPEIFFIGVDQPVSDSPSNFVGLQSHEHEIAFVVGYLAGLVTESNVVAGVYGIDFVELKRFRNGYEQGVAYAAEQRQQPIEVLGVYLDSFSDPEAGAAAAQSFIDAGADVIFGAAGSSGNGAILHAAQAGVYVIGVDQDQYFTLFAGGEVAGADKIITSALKRVNVGLSDLLSALIEGNDATYPGGETYRLTLNNGGLAFALAHEADIPNTVYDQVTAVEQALINGELATGVDPEMGNLITDIPTTISQICFVANERLLVDSGYFQTIHQGIETVAEAYDLEISYLTDLPDLAIATDAQLIDLLEQCLATGAEVIITGSTNFGQATTVAAQANPDTFFIGVDQSIQDGPRNYSGIQSQEDEASFLVGYLAGLVTESNIVAGIYGPDFVPLKRFRNGYEQGVRLAAQERDTEIEILGIYLDTFESPTLGAEAAQTFIDAGADVIFGAGGISGSGAILHAAQAGVYVIGVDQDEYFTLFDAGQVDGADKIITSALKRVDSGVIDLLTILATGNTERFPGGQNYVLTVANGGLTFANPHQADIPDAIYDQVAEVEQALANGELSTGVDPQTGDLLAE